MALNRLTIAEMISLTKNWAKPGTSERAALERVPSIKALMPHTEYVHERLLVVERVTATKTKTELNREISSADERFDDFVRGIIYTFDGQVFLAKARGDRELAEALETMRDFLMPHGLKTVSLAYREESGQADLTAARLKQEHRDFLQTIPVMGGTMLSTTTEWIQAGQELGQLENQRADSASPTRQQNAAEARSLWIQMVHTIRSIVRMLKVEDPDLIDALHRVDRAEAAADASSDRAAEPDEPDEPTDPTDPDDPPAESTKSPAESTESPAEEVSGESEPLVDEPV